MALDLFRVRKGLSINDITNIYEGNGAPSGDALTEAGVGSIWLDTSGTGAIWQRHSSSTNTVADWGKVASEEFVTDAVSANISWREPVAVRDDSSTTLPDAATNTVDGVAITDGMRVLFSNGALNNIYIASGAPGNWTWTEDSNAESAGDTTYVVDGTDAGKRFTFNTTGQWVQTDQNSSDELQRIRDFIGKTGAGAESPTYSSSNVVTQGDNLETAIGALDAGVQAVDDKIGAPVTAGSVVNPANTVNQNLQAIDDWVAENGTEVEVPNVTTLQTLDTLPAGTNTAKWLVQVNDGNGFESAEIYAVTDGTVVDHTEYGVVRVGTKYTTKDITVTISGSGEMQLNVAIPGRSSTVKVRRIAIV